MLSIGHKQWQPQSHECIRALRTGVHFKKISLRQRSCRIRVMSSATLSKAEYQNLAAFRYALRQFLHFSEQAAKRAGVTPQQHQALLAIKGFPGGDRLLVGQLAERLQLRHHSTVELVDRMSRLKLVARESSDEDRRVVFVRLTPTGERVLGKLSSAHKDQLHRIGPQLSAVLRRLGMAK